MKLWTGRLAGSSHPVLEAINRSIDFDVRLWPYDIRTNRAHADMLARIGLLSEEEHAAIVAALSTTAEELRGGTFEIRPTDEDIHTAVERRVTELAPAAGGKLHTGRSRNDQVATDFRLFTLDAIAGVRTDLRCLIEACVALAERHPAAALPAYTHLQRGQPVLLAHHLLAYVEMFRRDDGRLRDTARRTRVSPLGAGACVGSSLPLDRHGTAKALGFSSISRNSMDAVGDRDFALELLATLSIIAVHASRLGEELVVWSTREFGFCRLHDSVATGSSMMPQKRNPDGAELIRGKSGRVFGSLLALLTAMKGLPLSYNKDLQEDKEAVFDAVDTIRLCLQMATEMLSTVEIDQEAMAAAIDPEVYATDLTERLVEQGAPLRAAHAAVAVLVRQAESLGKTIVDLDPDEVRDATRSSEVVVDPNLIAQMDLRASLSSKGLPGGTSPKRVREAIAEVRSWLTDTEGEVQ